MKIYIATKLERADEQRALAEALKQLGHELTYDWTTHGSVQQEGAERIREVAQAESEGVLQADLVIVLLPGGRGTHAELGLAIGVGSSRKSVRRLVLVGEQKDDDGRECAFYYHPSVDRRFATTAELLAFLGGLAAAGGTWL